MSELAWYKKRMEDPELPRETYMRYWNYVRELEFNANRTYHEGMKRFETQLQSQSK